MAELEGENSLIIQAQTGDKAAYGQLVQHYQRLVVSVAYRQGLDLVEAEDVAQEAFIKAWLALPRFRPAGGSLRAWLCRITINLAIDTQRRQRPQPVLMEEMPDPIGNPAEQAEAAAQTQTIRRALAQLPPASRAALILKEYEQLSYVEIASALDIPLGTVMSRLNYARRRLRELLIENREVA